ncbi:hypothetical protein RAB80_016997 [Fusarium oxysporum f. sp. vasinfectum]|nr:hypothetical protein RAB80_016997 [Fusarium oxysporum f. sp. vasinfectum]
MPGPQFSDPTRLRRRQRRTHSLTLQRRTVYFKLLRNQSMIMKFRMFLGKKGDAIRRSLRAGEKRIWKSKRRPTKEFEEHWQQDEVFQNMFTGYDSLIFQLLRSDTITTFRQVFKDIGVFFDDHRDVFDSLSLDIDDLPEDKRVKIQTPDVKIWQGEWKRRTMIYSTPRQPKLRLRNHPSA